MWNTINTINGKLLRAYPKNFCYRFPHNTVKTCVSVIISVRATCEYVYATTMQGFMCFALSCARLFLSGLSMCTRLLICSDVLPRKLGTRALSLGPPLPTLFNPFRSGSSSASPIPARCASFSSGYESYANGKEKFAKLHFRKLGIHSTLRFIERLK